MNRDSNYVKKYIIPDKVYDYYYRKMTLDRLGETHDSVASLLLDSSLIFQTQYDYKIVECGDYVQVYKLNTIRTRRSKKKEDKKNIDINNLYKIENYDKRNELQQIEYKNILRSKLNLQRIVKANENCFKTFITLTFKDNIVNIEDANKYFNIWRTKIKSIYKDFQYVCVPEYQKTREKKYGYAVVHYHLMTNIEINKLYKYTRRNKQLEINLIIPQKEFSTKQLENMTLEQRKKCYDVKYWSYGYSSVYPLKDINVVGYLTKYMTKDIDNRLWGKRKYLNSHNLVMPREVLIDTNRRFDYAKLLLIENLYDITYKNEYVDYFGNKVEFIEYKL